MNLWKQLIDVPSADPDDARRKRLLNIILIGMLIAVALLSIVVVLLYAFTDVPPDPAFEATFPIFAAMALVGFIAIYAIGRYWSSRIAGMIFLLFLTGLLFMSDTTEEVVSGRSTLYFVLPIVAASMLLRPSASFVFAAIITLVGWIIGAISGLEIYFFAPTAYFLVALVSWLAGHTLEQALRDLRTINKELDQRVADRTQEL